MLLQPQVLAGFARHAETGAPIPQDLVDRIRYYLEHEQERLAIARAGYARVMAEHRLSHRMTQLAGLLKGAMAA